MRIKFEHIPPAGQRIGESEAIIPSVGITVRNGDGPSIQEQLTAFGAWWADWWSDLGLLRGNIGNLVEVTELSYQSLDEAMTAVFGRLADQLDYLDARAVGAHG